MSADTGKEVVPEPIGCAAVELKVAKELLVPHSNQADVVEPFGLTLPLSVAEADATFVAALVETIGRFDTVVKLQFTPYELHPAELPALTRQ